MRTFRLRQEPLFDLVSHGRGGPRETGRHFTPAQIEQIRRTVQRAPEAVVKVLPRDSNDLKAIGKHLDYIGRYGKLELETDDEARVSGRAGRVLFDDWDLDIDDVRRQATLAATKGRKPPKLVHKLMFSMPPGTPPRAVHAAVKNFAREEFALQHRYAMVLHTDEPHPHVHVVVKAVSEQGVRLNIRKETLREWRREFARHLRVQGIAANATDRFVRGETKPQKLDGIYRPMRDPKRYSTHMNNRLESVAAELMNGKLRVEDGKSKLVQTRKEVERGWRAVSEILVREGQSELASQVERFVNQMPAPRTENEQVAVALLERTREPRTKEFPSASR